jgi:hypothetical protein
MTNESRSTLKVNAALKQDVKAAEARAIAAEKLLAEAKSERGQDAKLKALEVR